MLLSVGYLALQVDRSHLMGRHDGPARHLGKEQAPGGGGQAPPRAPLPRCVGQTDVFKKGADTGALVEAPLLIVCSVGRRGVIVLLETLFPQELKTGSFHKAGGALQPGRLAEKHLFKDHLTAGEAASLKMIYFSSLCFIFLS